MKKLNLVLLIICIYLSLASGQIDKKPGLKKSNYQGLKSFSSQTSQLGRLRSFNRLNPISIGNTTTLSLPDTIIEYTVNDTTRSIHTYDSDGNFLSWTSQAYLNPIWVNIERESYTYDDNGNNDTILFEEWENNNWINIERGSYTYDEYGYIITSVYEDWIDNTWVLSSQYRTINVYDDAGNLLSETGERYKDNEWTNAYKYDYTYDNVGNMLTLVKYIRGSDPWEYSEKTTYTYDSNRNVLTELRQYFENNNWSGGNLVNYTYDSNGNLISTGTTAYTYDSNGNLLSILNENNFKENYTYDANDNMLTWDFFMWNNDSNQWEQNWSEPCQIFIKTTYSGKIWNYPVRKFGNGISFLTYGQGNKMLFHWTPTAITGIYNINENNKILVFPNPVSTTLQIEGAEKPCIAKIYSIDGKQILFNPISDNYQVLNVSQLKNGIYILIIETPKSIITEKFIKQ